MSSIQALKKALIPHELVSCLDDDANCRRIASGIRRISECGEILANFYPTMPNASAFLAVFARWCDVGDDGPEPVKKLLALYDEDVRSQLSIGDYARVRMADGMVAMKTGLLDKAIEDFEIVLKLAEQRSAEEVLAFSNYWLGRCFRAKGNFDQALLHVNRGREIQLARGHAHCAAAMRVLEGLILVETGRSKEALQHLKMSEAVLSETDDCVSLGNIQSTYGRIMQHEARYRQAVIHFTKAIAHFQQRGTEHANVARSELDIAAARIQLVRNLRRNIDAYREQRLEKGVRLPARVILVKELSTLCEAIQGNLNRAALIYESCPNVRGLARVHLCRGHLHQVLSELEMAFQEASKAYIVAEAKQDLILMASARNLQGMIIEEATIEGEIVGESEGHSLSAQDYAGEAVQLAENTHDRRLLAWVHTWYGLTLSSNFSDTWDQAREEMDAAAGYLEPTVRDYIWEDFQILKNRLLKATTLDNKLIQWARGELGDKTFRQLEEDFADLVIPIAWRQEGKRISRVATRLSISPRKVRKVLGRLNYLDVDSVSAEDSYDSVDEPRDDPQPPRMPILVLKSKHPTTEQTSEKTTSSTVRKRS